MKNLKLFGEKKNVYSYVIEVVDLFVEVLIFLLLENHLFMRNLDLFKAKGYCNPNNAAFFYGELGF